MRISHWSSDGCSSDLAHRHDPAGVSVDAGVAGEGRLAEHALERRQVGAGPARLLLEQRGLVGEGVGLGHPLALEQRQRVARRSEEHTYELQSLLLITYAVFFLHKK